MTLLDVQCEHIILFLFIFLSHVWLTADCVSPRLTRSILQQLFYGLLFPSYLEAGEKTKGWKCYCFLRWRDGGIFFFFWGGVLRFDLQVSEPSPVFSRVSGRGHTGRHVQGELHHGADSVLLWQWREVLLRSAGLRKLFQVSPIFPKAEISASEGLISAH